MGVIGGDRARPRLARPARAGPPAAALAAIRPRRGDAVSDPDPGRPGRARRATVRGRARATSSRRGDRRRRRKRGLALLLAGLLGVAAAAAAVDLISVGEPLPDRTSRRPDYRPATPGVAATSCAARADRPLPWGVAVYTAANGDAVRARRPAPRRLARAHRARRFRLRAGTTGACTVTLGMLADMLRGRSPGPSVRPRAARSSAARSGASATSSRRPGGVRLVFEGSLRRGLRRATGRFPASGPE